MGSNNGNGRFQGPKRRRGLAKRRVLPMMEGLETRQLLSIGDGPIPQPSNNNLADVKNGPLARAGDNLVTIYQEYQASLNDQGQFHSTLEGLIDIRGDRVGLDVSGVGSVAQLQARLANLGMQVTAVDTTRRIVEGYLPIAQLPTVARDPQVSGILPVYKPFLSSAGAASNQGERALRADSARTQFNVNGTGVKVGVLSDSVNQFDNTAVAGVGLAESVATGDLPGNVQVLQDGQAGDTDEGRAMLEQIYDIAPGAGLAFATAGGGEVNFASNIRALAAAGARVIVDDVGYFAEPFFQDGIVAQAVADVTNNSGVAYFSSAGNSADDGYQSGFRGTDATVAGTAGRWMDFDPGPNVATTIPIAVRAGGTGAPVIFQWDNPFYITGGVTSDLDIYFLDANGAVVAQSNTNNIVQGTPLELIGLPGTATQIAIRVQPGSPDPTRVGIIVAGDAADFTQIKQLYGSGGGTTYATTWGHPVANEAMGVGAVPWWIVPPFSSNLPLTNEVFSSFGPGVFLFNPDGSRKAAPETRQKPDFSGTDGNDTSFFIPGFLLSTVNPPPRTGPATSTELDGNQLPNFFGTSSSAPNLAAVAALMRQLAPTSTPAQIRAAMIASALPLNGAAKGAWNVQGGYGLVQADAALTAIDTLRVVTVTPATGTTLSSSPNSVVVTFTRAINPNTVQASDLQFTSLPPGVQVAVTAANILNPTTVQFLLDITTAPGVKANGTFTYTIAQGAITSTDNRTLSAFSGSFTLSDLIAPRIAGTSFVNRTVFVQFSEAMRPDTINANTVQLFFNNQGSIPVSSLPGAVVRYDATNNRAIIDLSEVPQGALPSGTYIIRVNDSVTDLVGNRLNGEFNGPPPAGNNGVFPSGDDKADPNAEDNDNDPFIQVVPNLTLRAPQIVNVTVDQTAGPVTNNPRIFGTLYNRLAVEIYFSEPMDPASINRANILFQRSGRLGDVFSNPIGIDLVNLANPASPVLRYDPFTNRATIDLSQLTDAQLGIDPVLGPDFYRLVVRDSVTDLQGNRLDGEFNTAATSNPEDRRSTFPSGDQKPGSLDQDDSDSFFQFLPDLATSGPARFLRYDSGIPADQNTNVTRPAIVGTVTNSFPGTVSGLTVYAQFYALRPNGAAQLDLGTGGRGFAGTFDVQTTTDAAGNFRVIPPADLPDGLNRVRIVVVGSSDAPPLPGLSSRIDFAFRIDTTKPALARVTDANRDPSDPNAPVVAPGSQIPGLSTLRIGVRDPVNPSDPFDPQIVPTQLFLPALDPTTASNISNYTLLNLGPDGAAGGGDDQDLSRFIASASFVSTTDRVNPSDPYTGYIELKFNPGAPFGFYQLIARRPQPGYGGITDAAGNPIDGDPARAGAQDFVFPFELQSQPVYIRSVQALSPQSDTTPIDLTNPATYVASDPRAYFEQTVPGVTPRAVAPPRFFTIDFSTALDPATINNGSVRVIRSANSPSAASDGDFGLDSSFRSGVGYTDVQGITVTLTDSGPNTTNDRLLVTLPPGQLAADTYRLFLSNVGSGTIRDVFGNALDGEFLADRLGPDNWETQLPTGRFRGGLSGDGVQGGAFETGYVVVPNGNIIYARPDYVDSPFLPGDDPDGSLERPYPALAPEAIPSAANNFDANSSLNFGVGFNSALDRNQNGRFDRSALWAAQVASARGPVVVVALPGAAQRDPATGLTTQQTFVMAAPAGPDPVRNDASASVPYNTTVVFTAGSALKLQNASLFVQNQGGALQVLGGRDSETRVNFTSFSDDSVGGDSNRDGSPGNGGNTPGGGDWGGIVFRNFDQLGGDDPNPATNERLRFTQLHPFPVDGTLKGPNGRAARSGADDALSEINFARVRFGGGPVPRTIGESNGPVTMYNTRPALTNTLIADSKVTNPQIPVFNTVGAITVDFDSLREDELARGPLIRNIDLINNTISGIYIRATLAGQVRATDALDYSGPANSDVASRNRRRDYVVDDPLPYVSTTRIVVGQEEQVATNGQVDSLGNRLYIQPGMMFKMPTSQGIDVLNPASSINVGDRSYLNAFDLDPTYGPDKPAGTDGVLGTFDDFRPSASGDARVVFTSFYDDAATTSYRDPNTGAITTIVPSIDTDGGGNAFQPTTDPNTGVVIVPPAARWGGLKITSGALAVIDEATFRYGGGAVNVPTGTIGQRDVLAFEDAFSQGTPAIVTNSDFLDNNEAAISISANGLLAGDPLHPLVSGNPFFRNNVMQRNTVNALEVIPVPSNRNGTTFFGYPSNLDVDSVWDDTDLTYALRTTIVLSGAFGSFDAPAPGDTFEAPPRPNVALTLQSSLPDTLLADGSRIARPGEGLLLKLLNDPTVPPIGDGVAGMPAGNNFSDSRGGAGFLVGIDDGVDPPAPDVLVDPGAFSQLRIVGIGGNETTGQQRVPVTITSLRDDSVGKTVRGVEMRQALTGNTTAAAAGDGGVIGFGALSLTDYNLYDPRDGSIIDNADIRYLTRIEQQGGGLVDVESANPALDKLGVTPRTQLNSAKALTVSNSNLSSFSQVGLIAHPSGVNALSRDVRQGTPGPYSRTTNNLTFLGQPTLTFMYNNTIANMPVGVRIVSENANNTPAFPSPAEAVFLNNTFYNNPIGIDTQGAVDNLQNRLSHVYFLAMDNIFDTSSTAAIRVTNMAWNSQAQFNLYSNSGTDPIQRVGILFSRNLANGGDNAIFGNAAFRDAANGDFSLLPGSAAIDAGLSELGEILLGNSLRPIIDPVTGVRSPSFGRTNRFGGLTGGDGLPGDIVTLPGFPIRNFADQWIPVLSPELTQDGQAAPNGQPGPASTPGTFWYAPIAGERDETGFLRIDDPTTSRIGAGSRPFFDVGARERRIVTPPKVAADGVTAIVVDNGGARTVDFYAEGTTPAGASSVPREIRIRFDRPIDPSTVTNKSVQLRASGGDSIFDNANNSRDRLIDLSGKLRVISSFNTTALDTIVIDLSGLDEASLINDLFRVTIFGTGQDVIRDLQGNALDAENTVGGAANGARLPLPSGDGVPGGNFYFEFAIDRSAPQVVAGTLRLDPGSDTGRAGDNITSSNRPTFTGRISDTFDPTRNLTGQVVFLELPGPDNVFGTADDIRNAGTALTTAGGNFTVTVGADAAGTGLVPANLFAPEVRPRVGPDGWLGPNPSTGQTDDDFSSYSRARVRVVDQSGNASDVNAPQANASFVVDTQGPHITATSPVPGTVASNVSNGNLTVSLVTNENVDPASVTAAAARAVRAGIDGVFGTADDVTLTVSNVQVTPLRDTFGSMQITFTIAGATANDLYQVSLLSGASGVRDWAGNTLDGDFSGVFPSGNNAAGGDFTFTFVVFNPANPRRTLFVDDDAAGAAGATGSRTSPFGTITAALAVAGVGDTVAVLPGLYTETVNLKSLVRVVSAATSSTDANLVAGQALQTVIRPTTGTGVTATNLMSIPGLATELSGFSILLPLSGNSLDLTSFGIRIQDSDVLIDRNYVINAGYGIHVDLNGVASRTPRIEDNVIVGNQYGMVLDARDARSFAGDRPTRIANNDFAYNFTGLLTSNNANFTTNLLADVVNNIFAQNFTGTASPAGAAIFAEVPTILNLRGNLFSNNGPSLASGADDVQGIVGGAFNNGALGAVPDANGNFVGNPGFANPRDPRPSPQGQGSAVFFLDSNFDLTAQSAAIDNAIAELAPEQDFRFRGRVDIPNRGRIGFGPADIGAFEYNGPSGVGPGGAVPGGIGSGTPLLLQVSNDLVRVRFSQVVDARSIQPSDLIITGDLDPSDPARATGVTFDDPNTVTFRLSGRFANGTAVIQIAEGSVLDSSGKPFQALRSAVPVSAPADATGASSTSRPTPIVSPAPMSRAAIRQLRRQAARERARLRRLAALQRRLARRQAQIGRPRFGPRA